MEPARTWCEKKRNKAQRDTHKHRLKTEHTEKIRSWHMVCVNVKSCAKKWQRMNEPQQYMRE